jgi:hypothetical protein
VKTSNLTRKKRFVFYMDNMIIEVEWFEWLAQLKVIVVMIKFMDLECVDFKIESSFCGE